jgi:GNAT superfamily N-acetyltransferase
LHHIYVLREYRKHNIAKLLMCALLEELKAAGYARMCCQIAVWNEPSMRLFAGVGFQRVAHVRFFKFFGILRLWLIHREGETRFTLTRAFSIGCLLEGRERQSCGADGAA